MIRRLRRRAQIKEVLTCSVEIIGEGIAQNPSSAESDKISTNQFEPRTKRSAPNENLLQDFLCENLRNLRITPPQLSSRYQLSRRCGSKPASVISRSICPTFSRNAVPALDTTFSSIITLPKSFAP